MFAEVKEYVDDVQSYLDVMMVLIQELLICSTYILCLFGIMELLLFVSTDSILSLMRLLIGLSRPEAFQSLM